MRRKVSTVSRVRRALMRLGLALPALPSWTWAADFGFRPPRDPDDPAAEGLMRDLAERILPVYQDADTDSFLANVTALQIVSGAYRAAAGSSKSLRERRQGKPFDLLAERAVLDGIYANARMLKADGRTGFAEAYARSFHELVSPLDNPQAQAVMARLEIPPAAFREPLRQAFDQWRAKGSLPEADALALVRTWLSYQSRRGFNALLPELFAAQNGSRYVAEADVRIPVRGGVIHASVIRPGRADGGLPALLRFTLDPSEDDARLSAARGYVGVTAYVRGARPTARARCGRSCATAMTPPQSSTGSPGSRGATAASRCSAKATPATPPGRRPAGSRRRSRPSPPSRRWRRASTSRWRGRSSATPWSAGRRSTRWPSRCTPASTPTRAPMRSGRHWTRAGTAATDPTGTSTACCWASAAG